MEKIKTTKLGGRLWTSILIFGLIGQIAWIVENMYFAKFMQYEITRDPFATTLMVALSAVAATVATIFAGALCDKSGKRKLFICFGYILWGLITMAFALIPIDFSEKAVMGIVVLVIAMDCLMSIVGAASNDAAFNTWVTDITDTTNRGKVDVALSILPLIAMIIVFVGLDSMAVGDGWKMFFVILGAVPVVGGILGFFLLKDSKNIVKSEGRYWHDVFYGFRKSVIKENKMLYVALLGSTASGAAMQVYQPYLISFVEQTLEIKNYVIPLAVIILSAAAISVVISILMDKYGKEKFYYPTIIMSLIGGILIFVIKFFSDNYAAKMAVLLIGGIAIMGAALIMGGLFIAAFRDYIPKGKEGCFQGIRMCLFVLVPMIIGPVAGNIIIESVGLKNALGELLYPTDMFLGASIIMLFAFVPAFFVRKNDKIIRAKLIAERDAMLNFGNEITESSVSESENKD